MDICVFLFVLKARESMEINDEWIAENKTEAIMTKFQWMFS